MNPYLASGFILFKCLLGNHDLYFKLKWMQIQTYETQAPQQKYILKFNFTEGTHEPDLTIEKFSSHAFPSGHCDPAALEEEVHPNKNARFFQTCHIRSPD